MTNTKQAEPSGEQKVRAPRRMARQKPQASPAPSAVPAPVKTTRLAVLTGLLSRAEGATIAAMQDATGWQAHSVRGFLAGTLKKRGFAVTSEPAEGGRVYRIAAATTDA